MEEPAGARDDRTAASLRRMLLRLELLHCDAATGFDGAARIYRRRCSVGITPRGMVDCMIKGAPATPAFQQCLV